MAHPREDLDALVNEFCEFRGKSANPADRDAVIDVLAQLCRLIVDMCSVPLVQPSPAEEFDFNQLFVSSATSGVPTWLACLISAGGLSTDFNIKAICLHTVLDLIEASTSIHGWTGNASSSSSNNSRNSQAQQPWSRSGLLLPVLSPDVLKYLSQSLDFFPVHLRNFWTHQLLIIYFFSKTNMQVVGVSLWFFLNNSTYTEDAAALLIRMLTVAPNNNNATCSTEVLVENFIVRQMLSPEPELRLSAHVKLSLLPNTCPFFFISVNSLCCGNSFVTSRVSVRMRLLWQLLMMRPTTMAANWLII